MQPTSSRLVRLSLAFALSCLCSLSAFAEESKRSFDVPAGPAETALKVFAEQSGRGLLVTSETAKGITTKAVKGAYSVQEALDRMLADTGLVSSQDAKNGAFVVKKEKGSGPNAERAAQTENSARPEKATASNEKPLELPTFEVMGRKLLNMDIKRSRDDAQPYVIFQREMISNSGATNLEDFLRTRLTMNSVGRTTSVEASVSGSSSTVNLRGLGAGQTLILVDGRRLAAKIGATASPDQPDINGIPLAAIERVEVLPSTASGIYGGSATGGVINVILRRDYSGAELRTTYSNTFSSDSAGVQIDLSAGFNLEGGKTNVLFAATWSDRNALSAQDRDFFVNGRARVLANNPGFFLNAASPPLGATPNIRSVNGSPLFGPGSSNITFVPVGYAGGDLAALQANAGKYSFSMANNASSSGAGGRRSLLNNPSLFSASLTARRQFTPRLQGFMEIAGTFTDSSFLSNAFGSSYTVAATALNNPFGQAVRVTLPQQQGDAEFDVRNDSTRFVVGAIAKLPWQNWQATADYSFQRSVVEWLSAPFLIGTETAPVSAGTIDVLRDLNRFPADFSPHSVTLALKPRRSDIHNGSLRVSGPVGKLPGGAPTVSTLIEYRDEHYGSSERISATAQGTPFLPFSFILPARSQKMLSVYAETKLPLISPAQEWPWLREVELQLAARYDEFKIDGATNLVTPGAPILRASQRDSSTNPTIGLRFKSVDDAFIRVSYGKGFFPPNAGQLTPNQPVVASSSLTDPRRGNAVLGTITQIQGGNPNLRPEESESWSAGLVFTPRFVPGLRLSLDWTRIEKTDNIVASLNSTLLLSNEDLFPGRITRGPKLLGDPADWAGPITAMDFSAINLASGEVEAWDAALDYTWQAESLGKFSAYAVATWTTHFKTQATPVAAVVESAGIANDPLRFKANGGLTWKRGNWTVGWASQRFNSYQVLSVT